MICYKSKFVEVHIPRTGGTSRKESLKAQGFESAGDQYDHRPAKWIKNHLGDSWGDYYKFSFRRNPAEIAVSLFHYWRDIRKERVMPGDSFDNWVNTYLVNQPLCNPQELSSHIHYWLPEVEVYLFDDLQEVWPEICDRIGAKPTLPKLNSSKYRKPWREYYDESTFQTVKSRFAVDIAFFGWPDNWEL